MQMIEQSAFRHEKMKRDVFKAITGANKGPDVANKNLPTLEEYYQNEEMIYDKFANGGRLTNQYIQEQE